MTEKYVFYNAVNHPVLLYHQNEVAMNRKEQYFLENTNAAPYLIVHQNRPLSAHAMALPIQRRAYETGLFLPEGCNSYLDFPPNPYSYDVIIVSTRYAKLAISTPGVTVDYLDRLYTPIPVYKSEPSKEYFNEKVGSVGFRKAMIPRMPQDYLNLIQLGQRPSLASIHACLEFFKKQPCYDAGINAALQQLDLIIG